MVVIGKILCSPVVHTFLWIKKTLSTLFSIKDGRIEQMFAAGELPQFFNCVCCSLVFLLFFFSFLGYFFLCAITDCEVHPVFCCTCSSQRQRFRNKNIWYTCKEETAQ